MRIAVTGSTGFLGRNIVRALHERSHEVRALDRSTTGDIGEVADWSQHLAEMDVVVHLAALAHSRAVSDAQLRAVNVDSSIAIGRAAAAAGTRMIFMSTVKVLGEETSERPFDDDSPSAPQDAYARAKAGAEEGLRSVPGLRLCVLRPPLVYGPGVRANFLALLRAVARGWPLPFAGIRNRRSLIGAGNLAHAVAACAESRLADGKAFLVSDGVPLSTPELCRAMADALGRSARLMAIPLPLLELAPSARKLTRSLVLDDGAIRRELGWAPPRSLGEELNLTVEWFRTQGG